MQERTVTWDDVAGRIAGPAHLATADATGTPAVAVVFARPENEEGDGVVWVQTRRGSTKARNVLGHPPVALMWQGDGEIYVWGRGEVVDDVATKQRLWDGWPYDAAGFFGAPDADGVVLLRITPTRATVLAAGDGGPERLRWNA